MQNVHNLFRDLLGETTLLLLRLAGPQLHDDMWHRFAHRSVIEPGSNSGQAVNSRGMTLTVAERARAPIIAPRYGLSRYFAR